MPNLSRWSLRKRATVACTLLLVALSYCFPAYPCYPPIFRQKEEIEVSVSEPDDGSYVIVYKPVILWIESGDINDWDERSFDNGETWIDYEDNAWSGTAPDDYHIMWAATAGLFDNIYDRTQQPPVHHIEEVSYGTDVVWIPPGDIENPVETVTFWVTADDINRGDDTAGFNDDPAGTTHTLKVWRLNVTAETDGWTTVSQYNSCQGWYASTHCAWGTPDNRLKYVSPDSPTGCETWSGKMEFIAEIPSEVPEADATKYTYRWRNQADGYCRWRYTSNGTWKYELDWRGGWHPDGPWLKFQDRDPVSPSAPMWEFDNDPPDPFPQQAYVRHLYTIDSPSPMNVGTERMEYAAEYDRVEYDADFRMYVVIEDAGKEITASNLYTWQFQDGVWEVDSGKWEETATPTWP